MTKPALIRQNTSAIQTLVSSNTYRCDGATYRHSRTGSYGSSCDYNSLSRCSADGQVTCSYHSLSCNGETGHTTDTLNVTNPSK